MTFAGLLQGVCICFCMALVRGAAPYVTDFATFLAFSLKPLLHPKSILPKDEKPMQNLAYQRTEFGVRNTRYRTQDFGIIREWATAPLVHQQEQINAVRRAIEIHRVAQVIADPQR